MPTLLTAKLQQRLAVLLIVLALVLLIVMVYLESEPGGVPVLLLVAGFAGFIHARFRSVNSPQSSVMTYRYAVAIALATTVFLILVAGGVGVLGRDGDPANWVYSVVLAIGVLGTVISHRQANGMAWTLFIMACAMMLVASIALSAGLQHAFHNSITEILLLNGFFALLYTVSGLLFRQAARLQAASNSKLS